MIRYFILSSLFMAFGLLCYQVLLKQEKSFQINRFFLLATILISLAIPFISIPVDFLGPQEIISISPIHIVDEGILEAPTLTESTFPDRKSDSLFSWSWLLLILYSVGAGFMVLRFVKGLLKIKQIRRLSKPTVHQNVFINLRLSQPFSFWNRVFLCNEEQLQDKHLMTHEMVHVSELHSLDILLMELLMIVYWFNPLVYWYRKIISLNHEYIADHKALTHHLDIKEYLHKVVGVSQNHRPQLTLASNFSFVSLKSRLIMITKKESTQPIKSFKWSLILVLLLSLFSAFTLKPTGGINEPEKEFVVVIDAGHGGEDLGTSNQKGHNEKDVVLIVAKLLQEEFVGTNIKVVMTRSDDTYLTLEERIAMTENADLNVSLHIETMDSDRELQLFIYDESMPYAERSEHIARVMALQFDDEDCGSVGHSTYRVLREAKCPSVMAILGVFSNPDMEKKMLSKSGQKDIAGRLSKAIRIASL